MHSLAPCLAIVGPTASGKSDLALALATQYGGEIVNFDSVQVYRRFDIGTAKTPPEQRNGIRHHLIDHVEPGTDYSAGDFARDARARLEDMRSRAVLPVLVGGTGLYLEALLKGLFRGPLRNPDLRERLRLAAESHSEGYLWRLLQRLDRHAAEAIHRNDSPKLVRAIEVCLAGSRPMTEQWRDPGEPLTGFQVFLLGLDPCREALYARIESRTRRMFAEGLVEEVQGLLSLGIPRTAKPFGALGYAQCLRYLDGECSLHEAIESTSLQTRRYAKRQMTWFRRRTPGVTWRQGFGDSDDTASSAFESVSAWLGEGRTPAPPTVAARDSPRNPE